MIIEFPIGHEYDLDKLVAGITVFIGHGPQTFIKTGESGQQIRHIGWDSEKSDSRFFIGKLGAPCTTLSTTSTSSTYNYYRVEVIQKQLSIEVHIKWGSLDPINEVIGYWRYGNKVENKPETEPFELK